MLFYIKVNITEWQWHKAAYKYCCYVMLSYAKYPGLIYIITVKKKYIY